MSRRALAVLVLFSISIGAVNAFLLIPRIGLWGGYAFLIVLSFVVGPTLVLWDRRTGKHGWFS
jgi:hypothetical protein